MRNLRLHLLLSLLIAITSIPIIASAEEITLRGTILSAVDREPLEGASIAISSLTTGTVSDAEGHFSLTLEAGKSYRLQVSFVGYRTETLRIKPEQYRSTPLIISLSPEEDTLQELVVEQKSEARQLRTQAMPVSILSAREISGKASSVEGILSKTVGITIRSQGGVGGATRVSLRGLEGKRIGFYVDGSSISSSSDFVSINDIPINMIERVEVYKGVIPAKLGGSGMGGAVNIVMKEYPPQYVDASYGIESYNTHKATLVLKHHDTKRRLEIGGGGYFTHSDNNYIMETPLQKGLFVERDHDKYTSYCLSLGGKLRDYYFDEIEMELQTIRNGKQIQGILHNIRHAHSKAAVTVGALKLKKKDFLLPGLDLDCSTGYARTHFQYIDTASVRRTWQKEPYPPVHLLGGETGAYPSNSHIISSHLANKLDLEYHYSLEHSFDLNIRHGYTYADPHDELRLRALGYQTLFVSRTQSLTAGLTHTFTSEDRRWVNALTGKYYHYSMSTRQSDPLNATHEEREVSISKHYFGVSDAVRYNITEYLMAKGSLGYEVRTPTETELIGDGFLIAPSSSLLPERGLNTNLSLLWDSPVPSGLLQMEISLFGTRLKDMIRQTKNFLQTYYENFGLMQSWGIEAEVKADLLPWLYAYANATYQDLRDIRQYEHGSSVPNPTYGLRIPNTPYLLANGGVELHRSDLFGWRGSNLRLFGDLSFVEGFTYDFEQSIYQEKRIPRSLRLDLGLEYSMLNERIILSANVHNATNARLLSEFNHPLPGRVFAAKIRYILH